MAVQTGVGADELLGVLNAAVLASNYLRRRRTSFMSPLDSAPRKQNIILIDIK
jgi:hypothetical protein